MEEASRDSVCMLLSSVSQYEPREGERPQPYLLRLSENIIFEFLTAEFSSGSLTALSIRPTFYRLSDVIVQAGGYSGPHSSQHLSSLAVTWATDTHREQLIDRFWRELSPREKSAVLRGADCGEVGGVFRFGNHSAWPGARSSGQRTRSHDGAGKPSGCAGSLALAGGRCPGQPCSGSGSATSSAARSRAVARSPDVAPHRTARRGNGAGDGAAPPHERRSPSESSRNAALPSP